MIDTKPLLEKNRKRFFSRVNVSLFALLLLGILSCVALARQPHGPVESSVSIVNSQSAHPESETPVRTGKAKTEKPKKEEEANPPKQEAKEEKPKNPAPPPEKKEEGKDSPKQEKQEEKKENDKEASEKGDAKGGGDAKPVPAGEPPQCPCDEIELKDEVNKAIKLEPITTAGMVQVKYQDAVRDVVDIKVKDTNGKDFSLFNDEKTYAGQENPYLRKFFVAEDGKGIGLFVKAMSAGKDHEGKLLLKKLPKDEKRNRGATTHN